MNIRYHFQKLSRQRYIPVLAGLLAVPIIGSLIIWIMDPESFQSLQDALWWAFVTITTVGYGDMVPGEGYPRVMAVIIMFGGIVFVSMLTATISSTFVTRKIREGKGLAKIIISDHIVICGWNERAIGLIESIISLLEDQEMCSLVLINDLPEEEVNNIIFQYKNADIQYVRGDFTKEFVLERANVMEARAVIIIPGDVDVQGDPDEKTVLATLSIKSLSPDTPVIAFINHSENKSHLKRANADEVIVRDEYSGFILASSVLMPGVPQTYFQLMNHKINPSMVRKKMPPSLVGKTFKEASLHFRESDKSILIGVVSEQKKVSFSDFLSSDTSHLDAFIERKLRMAGHSLGDKSRINIHLNPEDTYLITEDDMAVLIR
jgi:voltage-gated potassium channel